MHFMQDDADERTLDEIKENLDVAEQALSEIKENLVLVWIELLLSHTSSYPPTLSDDCIPA